MYIMLFQLLGRGRDRTSHFTPSRTSRTSPEDCTHFTQAHLASKRMVGYAARRGALSQRVTRATTAADTTPNDFTLLHIASQNAKQTKGGGWARRRKLKAAQGKRTPKDSRGLHTLLPRTHEVFFGKGGMAGGVEWPGFLGGWGSVGPTCPPKARVAARGRRARQWRGLPRGAAVPANGEG